MYKQLIQRQLGYLVGKKIASSRKERRKLSFFSDAKRKEIILWMWLHGDKDKDQIKETIQDKFCVSDQDAEDIFYEAFPDGLDLDENKVLDDLDETLSRTTNMKPAVVTNVMDTLTGKAPETVIEHFEVNPVVTNQLKLVIGTLLKRRQLP